MAELSLSELGDELNRILKEYAAEVDAGTEKGLNKAADYLTEKYRENTPTATGKTKESWVCEKKYHGVKYINNTELTKQRIPVANLLEFSKKGKPFIRRTFEENTENIVKIIVEEINRNASK